MPDFDEYYMEEYWESNDNQDGTYFSDKKNRRFEAYDEELIEAKYEKNKYNAALYIRANFSTLMKLEDYKKAYCMLLDELIQQVRYAMCDDPDENYSPDYIKLQEDILDMEILSREKEEIQGYKREADQVVEWVRSCPKTMFCI